MKQPPDTTTRRLRNQRSIDKQIESFPPLSSTVSDVMEVTAAPHSSANDLMKAILPDQAMCLAILKIANSVLYGRPKKVSSLETAIVVLGFDEVRSIVLGKAAVKTFQKLCQTYRNELETFWEHGFTAGLAARIVAEHLGIASGQFFMGGLLHDIGKLAMLLCFGPGYLEQDRFSAFSSKVLLDQEAGHYSFTHCEIGARLLRHWQFPDTLVSSLKHHHEPYRATQGQGHALIIQIADFLAHMHHCPEQVDEARLKAHLETMLPEFSSNWRALNLPWEDTSLEYWYAWLKVDREHGSSVLDILAA